MSGRPAVRFGRENADVYVESISFDGEIADKPQYAHDVETHESGLRGVVAGQNRVETQAVAVEAN